MRHYAMAAEGEGSEGGEGGEGSDWTSKEFPPLQGLQGEGQGARVAMGFGCAAASPPSPPSPEIGLEEP